MEQQYRLVPYQPTDEMRDAGNLNIRNRGALFATWKNMWLAAPDVAVPFQATMMPIDSAPTDGTEILVFGEYQGELTGKAGAGSFGVAKWSDRPTPFEGYDWQAAGDGHIVGWYKATHWLPTPERPI
jgi:hypothetical protein